MTNPVYNLSARLVDKDGFVLSPWNSFFQQFTQKAPAVQVVAPVTASPFFYTPNARGNLYISGGTVSDISLIRGDVTIVIAASTAITRIVPIGIGDTVRVTYTVKPTIQFLGE